MGDRIDTQQQPAGGRSRAWRWDRTRNKEMQTERR
jgi:hypothetical protein